MLQLDVWNIVFTVINVIILFVLLRIFLFKPVKKIIAARQEEADRQIDEANLSKEEAEKLKVKYEAVVADAESEKKKVMQDARKSADEEYQRIVNEAKKEAELIRLGAVNEAKAEKTKVIKQAEKEIAEMVVEAATKVVTGENGNSAIYDRFLDKAGDK